MLVVAGVDHIITVDLHSSQIQGFFNKPVDNLTGEPVIARYLLDTFTNFQQDSVIISKNAGGTKRVTSMADKLKIGFALIHREKHHISGFGPGKPVETRLTLVGDVTNKTCFM